MPKDGIPLDKLQTTSAVVEMDTELVDGTLTDKTEASKVVEIVADPLIADGTLIAKTEGTSKGVEMVTDPLTVDETLIDETDKTSKVLEVVKDPSIVKEELSASSKLNVMDTVTDPLTVDGIILNEIGRTSKAAEMAKDPVIVKEKLSTKSKLDVVDVVKEATVLEEDSAISKPDDIEFPVFLEPTFDELEKSLLALTEEQQRAVKGLLGTAIGDAVGLPFELRSHVKNRHRLDKIVNWKGPKADQQRVRGLVLFLFGERMTRAEGTPFGRTYSDDTVCTDLKMHTIARVSMGETTPVSVDDARRKLFEEMMAQYLVWAHCADGRLFQGYGGFTKDLLKMSDGNSLAKLWEKLKPRGKHVWHTSAACSRMIPTQEYLDFADAHFRGVSDSPEGADGNGGSWGNGAVMSFTPGFLLSKSTNRGVLAEAAIELAMSHRHPSALVGAELLRDLLDQVHAGKVACCDGLSQAVLRCPSWANIVLPLAEDPQSYMHPISAFLAFLERGDDELAISQKFVHSLNSEWTISGDDRFGPFGEALRIVSNGDDTGNRLAVKDNPSELVRFSQRGLNSVLIAIWCVVGSTCCFDWIEKVLYIGGDADTIGAVAGQIACPLLGDVMETFKDFVALDNHFLSDLHAAGHAASRRYFHRAVLFASGHWSEMLCVPRLVDPHYEGITEKCGVRLLGAEAVSDTKRVPKSQGEAECGVDDVKSSNDGIKVRCMWGSECKKQTNWAHRKLYAHPGDPDFEFAVHASGLSGLQWSESKIPSSRTRCKYGEKCYDKNATHRKVYSHPGDSDYYSRECQPVTVQYF